MLPFPFWSQLRCRLCQIFSERSLGHVPSLCRDVHIVPEWQPSMAGPCISLQSYPLWGHTWKKAATEELCSDHCPGWISQWCEWVEGDLCVCLEANFSDSKTPQLCWVPVSAPTQFSYSLMSQEMYSLRETALSPHWEVLLSAASHLKTRSGSTKIWIAGQYQESSYSCFKL